MGCRFIHCGKIGYSPARLYEWVKKTEFDRVSEQACRTMISFIDERYAVFRVEPIYWLLSIAPSIYYETIAKRMDIDRLRPRPQ